MEGVLNKNKTDYVLFHLSCINDINGLIEHFRFLQDDEKANSSQKNIYFRLTDKGLDYSRIKYHHGIPILYPINDSEEIFFLEDGNLFFNDDLLKSAFYLLSGYQEYNSKDMDQLGRYDFQSSIQYKLSITAIPVVNYYFQWILNGIDEFCKANGIKYNKQQHDHPFTFFLTHDIDRLRFYSLNNFLQRIKDILGITQNRQSKAKSFKQMFDILMNISGILKNPDPWWNFEYLTTLEKKNGIISTFYFLQKDIKHRDSYYNFSDPEIKELIHKLIDLDCEAGIHGTISSASDLENMRWQKLELEKITGSAIKGVRQHNLIYSNPETARIHQEAKYQYDSTLGFAEHEGFRNSYCHPFRLYNFQQDKAFDCWEIPLNAMDVTLFHYRNMDIKSAKENLLKLISEIKKFNGIFSLLWHNNHFNEDLIPGITEFYEKLLHDIMQMGPLALRGEDIIKIVSKK